MSDLKTPQTHPNHPVVGRYWGAQSIKHEKTAVYFCDSYDPSCGYWMTNIHDKDDRVNISERAPFRTWWLVEDKGDYYYVTQWGVRVAK